MVPKPEKHLILAAQFSNSPWIKDKIHVTVQPAVGDPDGSLAQLILSGQTQGTVDSIDGIDVTFRVDPVPIRGNLIREWPRGPRQELSEITLGVPAKHEDVGTTAELLRVAIIQLCDGCVLNFVDGQLPNVKLETENGQERATIRLAPPRRHLSHEARRTVECPAIARCDMDMMRDMVFELHFGTAQGGTHQRNHPRKVRETLYCHLPRSRGLMKLT